MATDLHFWHKSYVHDRYVLELKIWLIHKNHDYPEGYKYRLICIDQRTGRRVLLDNHSPKGHHMHMDDKQFSYRFTTEQNLIDDFKRLILDHMGVKL
jgi:hypothetical protein